MRDGDAYPGGSGPGLREALGVWALVGVAALTIFVTYARLPASEFYNVSRDGLAGGASRALLFLNFPGALLALAPLGFALARLSATPGALSRGGRRVVGVAAAVAAGLCFVVAGPGVVDQGRLDARPINALPALGVALALALTVYAARATGVGAARPWTGGDTLRAGAAGALLVLGLPWVLADLGVYAGDVPGLGALYVSKQAVPGEALPAVHLGHHHGLDGLLFAWAALALARQLGRVASSRWRAPLAGFLGLMLAYGLANAAQDFSLEQVVRRGWAAHELPSVLRPGLTPAWGLLLVGAAVAWVVLLLAARGTGAAPMWS